MFFNKPVYGQTLTKCKCSYLRKKQIRMIWYLPIFQIPMIIKKLHSSQHYIHCMN